MELDKPTPTPDIRRPAVAGSFYPAAPGELTKTVAGLYAEVDRYPIAGRTIGLIAPHAGYPYSGRIAAKAYKLLQGEEFETVVIISPSHTVFFRGCSVFNGDGYATPLGVVNIDKDLSQKIAAVHPSIYLSNMGHASGSTRGEHGLEVHLPFLQIVLGTNFKLVAIVMGDQEESTTRALGDVLAKEAETGRILLVASSDLSHFHSEKEARVLDYTIQKAVQQYDPGLLLETLESGKGEACGGGPMAAVMMATRKLGGERVEFLDYTTSAEVTGDYDEVVGYLSAAIITNKAEKPRPATPAPAPPKEQALTDGDKQELLRIAKEAVRASLEGHTFTPMQSERLEAKRGVFVTLKIDGELRGCIGTVRARQPLYETVAEMAVAAAFDDPRFPSLSKEEFERLRFEISVLSSLERVHDFSEIKVGLDGLMIKLEMHSGLLLPQVATELKWSSTHFLEQVSLKAGLPKNSYKDKHAEIYRFSAEIFE
jgi:AmmeMemoRadiSam system protein B/AmmeMemoRadiSam system protein A